MSPQGDISYVALFGVLFLFSPLKSDFSDLALFLIYELGCAFGPQERKPPRRRFWLLRRVGNPQGCPPQPPSRGILKMGLGGNWMGSTRRVVPSKASVSGSGGEPTHPQGRPH
jgi:hypothetical protein